MAWNSSNVSLGMTGSVVVESSDYQSCTTGAAGGESDGRHPARRPRCSGAFNVQQRRVLRTAADRAATGDGTGPHTSVAYEVANDANCTAGQCQGAFAVFAITGLPMRGASASRMHDEPGPRHGNERSAGGAAGRDTAPRCTTERRSLPRVPSGWATSLWVAGNTGCTPSGDIQAALMRERRIDRGDIDRDRWAHHRSCRSKASAARTSTIPRSPLDSAGDAILTFDESSSSTLEVDDGRRDHRRHVEQLRPRCTRAATFYSPAVARAVHLGRLLRGGAGPVASDRRVGRLRGDRRQHRSPSCATANTCWNTVHRAIHVCGPVISSLSPAPGTGIGWRARHRRRAPISAPGTHVHVQRRADHDHDDSHPGLVHVHDAARAPSGLVQAQVARTRSARVRSPSASGYIYVRPGRLHPAPSPFRILDTRPTQLRAVLGGSDLRSGNRPGSCS